jgi:hypothetical protein
MHISSYSYTNESLCLKERFFFFRNLLFSCIDLHVTSNLTVSLSASLKKGPVTEGKTTRVCEIPANFKQVFIHSFELAYQMLKSELGLQLNFSRL